MIRIKKFIIFTILALFSSAFIFSCQECTGKSYQVIEIYNISNSQCRYTFRAFNTCEVWNTIDIHHVEAPCNKYYMSSMVKCDVLNNEYHLNIKCIK